MNAPVQTVERDLGVLHGSDRPAHEPLALQKRLRRATRDHQDVGGRRIVGAVVGGDGDETLTLQRLARGGNGVDLERRLAAVTTDIGGRREYLAGAGEIEQLDPLVKDDGDVAGVILRHADLLFGLGDSHRPEALYHHRTHEHGDAEPNDAHQPLVPRCLRHAFASGHQGGKCPEGLLYPGEVRRARRIDPRFAAEVPTRVPPPASPHGEPARESLGAKFLGTCPFAVRARARVAAVGRGRRCAVLAEATGLDRISSVRTRAIAPNLTRFDPASSEQKDDAEECLPTVCRVHRHQG